MKNYGDFTGSTSVKNKKTEKFETINNYSDPKPFNDWLLSPDFKENSPDSNTDFSKTIDHQNFAKIISLFGKSGQFEHLNLKNYVKGKDYSKFCNLIMNSKDIINHLNYNLDKVSAISMKPKGRFMDNLITYSAQLNQINKGLYERVVSENPNKHEEKNDDIKITASVNICNNLPEEKIISFSKFTKDLNQQVNSIRNNIDTNHLVPMVREILLSSYEKDNYGTAHPTKQIVSAVVPHILLDHLQFYNRNILNDYREIVKFRSKSANIRQNYNLNK